MNAIGNALEELYRIFRILNKDKFNNSLEEPVITIQKTKSSILGHFTIDRVWKDVNANINDNKTDENDKDSNVNDSGFYEINLNPIWFKERSEYEITETLLHEMVHYYNKVNGVKEGNHNKRFKELAEKVGLICEKGDKAGWQYTYISDPFQSYMEEKVKPNREAFEYFRYTKKKEDGKKREKKTFKYVCPNCGQEAKGKADIIIKCGKCDVEMEIQKDESKENNNKDGEN